jgi:hypothetical protein
MSFQKEYRRLHREKVAMRAEIEAIFDAMTPQDMEEMKTDIERFKDTPDVGILLPRTKGRKRKQYLKRLFSEENQAKIKRVFGE